MLLEPPVIRQIAPAEARGSFKPELLTTKGKGQSWVLEPKYDGIRELFHALPGMNRISSRHISKKTQLYTDKSLNFPQLSGLGHTPEEQHLFEVLLQGCVLDGELLLGENSMNAQEVTGSKPERAWELQEKNGWAQYKVFDILFWQGQDVRTQPYLARRKILEEEIFAHDFGEYFTLAPVWEEDKEEALARIFDQGGEGAILKDKMGLYGVKKSWVKVKRQETHDVVVMGYEEALETSQKKSGEVSATKYKGQIGSIKFGQFVDGELVEFGQCSGFDDALREEISNNRQAYLGRVMQIEVQQRLESGKFRHPRFIQFRDDKNPEQCVYYPEEK